VFGSKMCGFWVCKHIHIHNWIAQRRWQFYINSLLGKTKNLFHISFKIETHFIPNQNQVNIYCVCPPWVAMSGVDSSAHSMNQFPWYCIPDVVDLELLTILWSGFQVLLLISSQTCSIGLISGELADQGRTDYECSGKQDRRIFITLFFFFTHNQTQTRKKLSSLVTFLWVSNTPFQINFSGQHAKSDGRGFCFGVSLILAVHQTHACQCNFQTRETQHATLHSNCEPTKTPRILRCFQSSKLHFTRNDILSVYYGF